MRSRDCRRVRRRGGEELISPAPHHIRRVGHLDGEPVTLRAQADDTERMRGQAADRAEPEEDFRLQPRLLLMAGGRDEKHAVVVREDRARRLEDLVVLVAGLDAGRRARRRPAPDDAQETGNRVQRHT